MGKGNEGGGKGKGRERADPVPDCESAKVATLKCGGPPTMPEENRGPWSKKFENRCCTRTAISLLLDTLLMQYCYHPLSLCCLLF